MLQFEYDENRSIVNQSKHGISFNDAQSLWSDSNLVEIPAKASGNELRFLVIGNETQQYWLLSPLPAGEGEGEIVEF